MNIGKLIFFAGKMGGAGKSTKAFDIARQRNIVFLSEDKWLESVTKYFVEPRQ